MPAVPAVPGAGVSSLGRTFDVWDLVATAAGSAAAYMVMRRLVRVANRTRSPRNEA